MALSVHLRSRHQQSMETRWLGGYAEEHPLSRHNIMLHCPRAPKQATLAALSSHTACYIKNVASGPRRTATPATKETVAPHPLALTRVQSSMRRSARHPRTGTWSSHSSRSRTSRERPGWSHPALDRRAEERALAVSSEVEKNQEAHTIFVPSLLHAPSPSLLHVPPHLRFPRQFAMLPPTLIARTARRRV